MTIALAVLVSIPFVATLLARPVQRRLAVRHAVRRPTETALVVVGSLLGTAIITGSLVVGDSIDRSIRAAAYEQLGPVDELVATSGLEAGGLLRERFEGFRDDAIDGVLPLTVAQGAVAGPDGRVQPRAQILEVDFDDARGFGGDPSITGIEGPDPAPGEAAIGADLAVRLDADVGDTVTVLAYSRTLTFTVDRVLPREGVAGLWLVDGRQQSYNVFVPSGTIAELAVEGGGPSLLGSDAVEPPVSVVAFSNVGGVESGADRTDAAVAAISERLDELDARVTPVKRDVLDAAARLGDSLSDLYFTVGMFAVAAGVLLLVNIFVMLAEERRSELGMLRAIGMRRAPLVGAYATEGWIYATVSSAIGAVTGIGVGWAINRRADEILSSGDELTALNLTFAWEPGTVLTGFALGLVISLVTIVATSVRVSRLNVIAAIRDLPEGAALRGRRLGGWVAVAAVALGTVWGVASFATTSAFGVMLGPILVLVGVTALLARRLPTTPVVVVGSLIVLGWAWCFIPVLGVLDVDIEIPMFLAQGLVMTAAAVSLASVSQAWLSRALARMSRGALPVRLGLAYPLARRFRTAMTLSMFSIVVLTLVYISVMSAMFEGQVDDIATDNGGGFEVAVTTNPTAPIDPAELEALDGVAAVAPLGYVFADWEVPGRDDLPTTWPLTAFGPELLVDPPRLQELGDYRSEAEAWAAVLADPDLVIVDEFFLNEGGGLPGAVVDPGGRLVVVDPVSGIERSLTVAALAETDFVNNGAWYSETGFGEVFGARAVPSRFFVDTASPESVVATIEAAFEANGADAALIRDQVEVVLSQQAGFFTLMQQFVGAGLVVGIAGIGVIMVRAVRERRRQVGVLRSLGFGSGSVARTFVVEAAFVAVEGVVIGVGIALVASYGLVVSDNNFARGLSWTVPVGEIAWIVTIAVGTALVAALWPAYRASRIEPAVALRIAD